MGLVKNGGHKRLELHFWREQICELNRNILLKQVGSNLWKCLYTKQQTSNMFSSMVFKILYFLYKSSTFAQLFR